MPLFDIYYICAQPPEQLLHSVDTRGPNGPVPCLSSGGRETSPRKHCGRQHLLFSASSYRGLFTCWGLIAALLTPLSPRTSENRKLADLSALNVWVLLPWANRVTFSWIHTEILRRALYCFSFLYQRQPGSQTKSRDHRHGAMWRCFCFQTVEEFRYEQ